MALLWHEKNSIGQHHLIEQRHHYGATTKTLGTLQFLCMFEHVRIQPKGCAMVVEKTSFDKVIKRCAI